MSDLTGCVFSRWTVVSYAGAGKSRASEWLCRCECGKEKTVAGSNLRREKSRSCGCLSIELAKERRLKNIDRFTGARLTHGMFNTPTWRSWASMIQRCTNPARENYRYYGGRGIKVCDRWRRSFESFLADMGERPDGLTLERLENDGNYQPDNCVWASKSAQALNRRERARSSAC
jgi:hypothetical protein